LNRSPRGGRARATAEGAAASSCLSWAIFLIIVKLEDHDIRAPIFGMEREVAISRRIRILFETTTNRHDLQRTRLEA
jgi:hypothetical protein